MGHDKRGLTLSPEPTTTIAELLQRIQDAWDNLTQDDIRYLHDRFHARIHACIADRGGYTVIVATVWASLTVTCVSFDLNLLSYTPTMINYLSH